MVVSDVDIHLSKAINHIIFEIADVELLLCKYQPAPAILFAIFKLSFVDAAGRIVTAAAQILTSKAMRLSLIVNLSTVNCLVVLGVFLVFDW